MNEINSVNLYGTICCLYYVLHYQYKTKKCILFGIQPLSQKKLQTCVSFFKKTETKPPIIVCDSELCEMGRIHGHGAQVEDNGQCSEVHSLLPLPGTQGSSSSFQLFMANSFTY